MCCSVVEGLFSECERVLRVSMAGFSKFHPCVSCYSMTSAFSQCGLHSSGVNSETSLVYCLKSNGHTNFPKV